MAVCTRYWKKIPEDVKIIRDQYYQDDDNQYLWDDLYSKILKFKQRDPDSLSDIHSAPSVNQSTVYCSYIMDSFTKHILNKPNIVVG